MKLHSKIPAVAEKARNNFTPVLFAASGMRHNVTLAHLQGYLTLLRTVSVRRPNSLFFTVCDLQRIRPSFAYLTGKKYPLNHVQPGTGRIVRERCMTLSSRKEIRFVRMLTHLLQNRTSYFHLQKTTQKKTSHARDSSFPRFCCACE